MPLFPPVTTATLPLSLDMSLSRSILNFLPSGFRIIRTAIRAGIRHLDDHLNDRLQLFFRFPQSAVSSETLLFRSCGEQERPSTQRNRGSRGSEGGKTKSKFKRKTEV